MTCSVERNDIIPKMIIYLWERTVTLFNNKDNNNCQTDKHISIISFKCIQLHSICIAKGVSNGREKNSHQILFFQVILLST